MSGIPLQDKLDQVERSLQQVREMIAQSNKLYDNESRLQEILCTHVMPINMVAKQNMITNCLKNDELRNTQESLDFLSTKIDAFEKQLSCLSEYEATLKKLERRLEEKLIDMSKNQVPVLRKIDDIQMRIDAFNKTCQSLRHDVQLRDKELEELKKVFSSFHERTQADVKARISAQHKMIEEMYPRIQNNARLAHDANTYFATCKAQFDKIEDRLQEAEAVRAKLRLEVKELKKGDVRELQKNFSQLQDSIHDIQTRIIDSNNFVHELQSRIEKSNDKVAQFEDFVIYKQPLITHNQISDVLQEFLCIPDQMKLIQLDNLKMQQLAQFSSQMYVPLEKQQTSSYSQDHEDPYQDTTGRVPHRTRRDLDDPERIHLSDYFKIVEDLYESMKVSNNGCPRIDFVKDIQKVDSKRKVRFKMIEQDLRAKGDLVRRIYKFEKQIFIVQGKLDGTLPQNQDLLDEIENKDTAGIGKRPIVDLSDPNFRLKNYLKFQRTDDLVKLEIMNDERQRASRLQSKRTSEKDIKVSGGDVMIRPATGLSKIKKVPVPFKPQQLQEKDQLRGGQSQMTPRGGVHKTKASPDPIPTMPYDEAIQPHDTSSCEGVETRPPQLRPGHAAADSLGLPSHRSENFKLNVNASQSNEKVEKVDGKTVTITGPDQHNSISTGIIMKATEPGAAYDLAKSPDFRLLAPAPFCSKCGLKNNKLSADNIPNENHINGSGMLKNVIYDVIYVRGTHKINRQQHRYLSKKRAWLTRQIDPSKRYLYMLRQQANISEINAKEDLDYDVQDVEGCLLDSQVDQTGGDSGPEDTQTQDYLPVKSVTKVGDDPSYEDSPSRSNTGIKKVSIVQANDNPRTSVVSGSYDSGTGDLENQLAAKQQQKRKTLLKRQTTLLKGQGGAPAGLGAAQVQQMVQRVRMEIENSLFAQISQLRQTIDQKLESLSKRQELASKQITENKLILENAQTKQFGELERRMVSLEHSQDFLDEMLREKSENFEAMIRAQGDRFHEFKEYVNTEYIEFFRNRRKIRMELAQHAREYKNKFSVLTSLNEEFTYKFSYIDKILPVIVEQNRLTYNVILQDMEARERLSKSLRHVKLANSGYLLKEQMRLQGIAADRGSGEVERPGRFSPDQANSREQSPKLQPRKMSAERPQPTPHNCDVQDETNDFYSKDFGRNGLHLDSLNYRGIDLPYSSLSTYFENMTQKLEALIKCIRPFSEFWNAGSDREVQADGSIVMKLMKKGTDSEPSRPQKSAASKRVKTGKTDGKKTQQPAKKEEEDQVTACKNTLTITKCGRVFDDVHFGNLQSFLADAGRHQRVQLFKICDHLNRMENDDVDTAQDYLKMYLRNTDEGSEHGSPSGQPPAYITKAPFFQQRASSAGIKPSDVAVSAKDGGMSASNRYLASGASSKTASRGNKITTRLASAAGARASMVVQQVTTVGGLPRGSGTTEGLDDPDLRLTYLSRNGTRLPTTDDREPNMVRRFGAGRSQSRAEDNSDLNLDKGNESSMADRQSVLQPVPPVRLHSTTPERDGGGIKAIPRRPFQPYKPGTGDISSANRTQSNVNTSYLSRSANQNKSQKNMTAVSAPAAKAVAIPPSKTALLNRKTFTILQHDQARSQKIIDGLALTQSKLDTVPAQSKKIPLSGPYASQPNGIGFYKQQKGKDNTNRSGSQLMSATNRENPSSQNLTPEPTTTLDQRYATTGDFAKSNIGKVVISKQGHVNRGNQLAPGHGALAIKRTQASGVPHHVIDKDKSAFTTEMRAQYLQGQKHLATNAISQQYLASKLEGSKTRNLALHSTMARSQTQLASKVHAAKLAFDTSKQAESLHVSAQKNTTVQTSSLAETADKGYLGRSLQNVNSTLNSGSVAKLRVPFNNK